VSCKAAKFKKVIPAANARSELTPMQTAVEQVISEMAGFLEIMPSQVSVNSIKNGYFLAHHSTIFEIAGGT
jgi:hypothetical protein